MRWQGLCRLAGVGLGFLLALSLAHAENLLHLRRLVGQGAVVSARIIDLRTDHTLAALNPGQALIPASVSKLYPALAALKIWGAKYRFTTRVLRRGKVVNGILKGDLILRGSGDPGLTNAELWLLARRVREAGIRRVEGAIIIDQSKFGPIQCQTADRCAALQCTRNAYNAPLSAAGFDYSNVCVRLSPAEGPGIPAQVTLEPFNLPLFITHGEVRTLPADAKTHIHVLRTTAKGRDELSVDGGIAMNSSPQCIYRSVSHPARYTGQAFRVFLRQNGIDTSGIAVRIINRPFVNTQPVTEVRGLVLGSELRGMLTYSNNYMADMLALDLARTQYQPPLSLRQAGAWLTDFARRVDAESPWTGAHNSRPILASGSGLTPASRLSANDVIALLAYANHQYGDYPAFLSALSIPGQTPVAMLKGGDHAWMTRVMVKTGSLSRPVSVFALAGYLRLRNGDWGAFSVFINGSRHQPDVPLQSAIDAVRADLEVILHPAPKKSS